jgi:glutamate synthase (NADPH/NADH) small chain
VGDPKGFLRTPRRDPGKRPAGVRVRDWREITLRPRRADVERQAGRCMDCGIPFCHGGCPLGNLIPDWNDLVWRSDWQAAAERLHATNNFPEFTGKLCPAPCEAACVLAIDGEAVTIKQVEAEIAEAAWAQGWVVPRRPTARALAAGHPVAVIGSGPAGLAAAQQLTRAGHRVTVYERADRPGGLLRYGIPDFKMEKSHLDRRLAQLLAEGTTFRCSVEAGAGITAAELRNSFAAIVLACGAPVPRDLAVPGRGFGGIHFAMEYLEQANRAVASGDARTEPPVSARGRHVVIIGGGDTGADCLGTAHRQRAASVVQLEHNPRPPAHRSGDQPWPGYPAVYRVSGAHEEGGERLYAVSAEGFRGDRLGRVAGLRLVEVRPAPGARRETGSRRFVPVPGSERELRCDLVLLAMGFAGAERSPLLRDLGVGFTGHGTVARDNGYATSVPGVFAAGDVSRGQSLIVWAIAEGRSAAAAVDAYLNGRSVLPQVLKPDARPFG